MTLAKLFLLTLTAWFIIAASSAHSAERPAVAVHCDPDTENLVYLCLFKVTGRKSATPIEDAVFTINADMPSMPMAHNVQPVAAEPTRIPGEYRARIQLEMLGEWALKLVFHKPARDIVIKKLDFKSE